MLDKIKLHSEICKWNFYCILQEKVTLQFKIVITWLGQHYHYHPVPTQDGCIFCETFPENKTIKESYYRKHLQQVFHYFITIFLTSYQNIFVLSMNTWISLSHSSDEPASQNSTFWELKIILVSSKLLRKFKIPYKHRNVKAYFPENVEYIWKFISYLASYWESINKLIFSSNTLNWFKFN